MKRNKLGIRVFIDPNRDYCDENNIIYHFSAYSKSRLIGINRFGIYIVKYGFKK